MKPKVFIASSTEGLDAAYGVQESLESEVEATVWNQGVFAPSRVLMESLIEVLDGSDFGILVLTPDDVTKVRGETRRSVRDNVIFELGLFIGRLGRERCFMICPNGPADLALPSDLLGLTLLPYEAGRSDGNLVAALGPACNRIRRTVLTLGPNSP